MNRFTKRTVAVVVGIAVVVGGASVAYAYWTAGGSGTGTSATGTNVALTVTQTSSVLAMGPGVAAQNLSGKFNNTNTGPVYVGAVSAAIGTITGGGATCEATDYTLTNNVSTVNAEVPAGVGTGSWGLVDTPTLMFNNKAAENQDDCKGASVAIVYTIVP